MVKGGGGGAEEISVRGPSWLSPALIKQLEQGYSDKGPTFIS